MPYRTARLDPQERTTILDDEIALYLHWGFRIISRTTTGVHLYKRFPIEFWDVLFWLAVYPLYYWAIRVDNVVYTVDEQGVLHKTIY